MNRLLKCLSFALLFGSTGHAFAQAESMQPVARLTCANAWSTSTPSEKQMFLSGYLTALAGALLITGDLGMRNDTALLAQLWPSGDEMSTVESKLDTYCSSHQNASSSLAAALAAIAKH